MIYFAPLVLWYVWYHSFLWRKRNFLGEELKVVRDLYSRDVRFELDSDLEGEREREGDLYGSTRGLYKLHPDIKKKLDIRRRYLLAYLDFMEFGRGALLLQDCFTENFIEEDEMDICIRYVEYDLRINQPWHFSYVGEFFRYQIGLSKRIFRKLFQRDKKPKS